MKRAQSKKNFHATVILWLEHHIDSFKSSLNKHLSNPLSFTFTVLMIAIAISIPISLYILFSSVQQLTEQWDSDKQITLFLNDNVSVSNAQSVADKISNNKWVSHATVINKQQALEDFKQQMGLDSISADLAENPLPHLIIVEPETSLSDIDSLKTLERELKNLKQVQLVQFDLLWFQRLQAILDVITRVQWIVSIILLIAIALIIANVIRWEVAARHSEIEIIKMVGAPDAYVRRPFLYSGFWLGLSGSILALLIVSMSAWMIEQSTTQLASLFGSDFKLASLPFSLSLLIVMLISLLGVFASWIAVSHKLKQYT